MRINKRWITSCIISYRSFLIQHVAHVEIHLLSHRLIISFSQQPFPLLPSFLFALLPPFLPNHPPRRSKPPKTHRHPIQEPPPLSPLFPPLLNLLHLHLFIVRAARCKGTPVTTHIPYEGRGRAANGVGPAFAGADGGCGLRSLGDGWSLVGS